MVQMTKLNPKVSVVIPAHNRPAEVDKAIASVMAQTEKDFEIIVVDDCSSDDGKTVAAIAKWLEAHPDRIKLIKHDVNKGVSGARNTGINAATGDYIALLDSDDEWHPDKLEKQLAFLRQQPDPENTICLCDFLAKPKAGDRGQEVLWLPSHNPDLSKAILSGGVYNMGSTMLAHRKVFEKTGQFIEGMNVAEDYEWLVRHIARRGVCVAAPEVLSTYMSEFDKGYPRQAEQLKRVFQMHARTIRQNLGLNAYRYFIGGINEHLFHTARRNGRRVDAAIHLVKSTVMPFRFAHKVRGSITRRLYRQTGPRRHL